MTSAVAMVLAVVGLGYVVAHTLAAGGPALLSMSPASGSYSIGKTVAIQIDVNTGGDPVNAVEADFTYPTAQLQFQSIDGTGSVMSIAASSTGGGGSVKISRGNITPYTGTGLIATVNFTVLASGSAVLSFLNTSAVVQSTNNLNILGTATGANYSLAAPATTPAPTPKPATTPAKVTASSNTGKALPSPTPTVTPKSTTTSPAPASVSPQASVESGAVPSAVTPKSSPGSIPVTKLASKFSPQTIAKAAAITLVIVGLGTLAGMLLHHLWPNSLSQAQPPSPTNPSELGPPPSEVYYPDPEKKP